MSGFHFISKSNKCEGCPLGKTASIAEKVLQCCATEHWSVEYTLDRLGKTVCVVRKRRRPIGPLARRDEQ